MASILSSKSDRSYIEMASLSSSASKKKETRSAPAVPNAEPNNFLELARRAKESCLAYRQSPSRFLRSTYFQSLSQLGRVPAQEAMQSDVYIFEAERVNQGITFRAFPGSLNRLRPPAQAYSAELNSFEDQLLDPKQDSDLIKARLAKVVQAHIAFVRAFIPEFRMAARLTAPAVAMEYPKTLRLFNAAFLEVLPNLESEEYDLWRQWTQNQDEKLQLLFPLLGVFKLVCQAGSAELFKNETIDRLRRDVSQLSNEDRIDLFNRIKGNHSPNPRITSLYRQITGLATQIQRGDCAQVFNVISKILFVEWGKVFEFLDEIKPRQILTAEEALKWMLKGFLTKEKLTAEMLPRDFYNQPSRDAIFQLREAFLCLDEAEKKNFLSFFLDGEPVNKNHSNRFIEKAQKTVKVLFNHSDLLMPGLLAKIAARNSSLGKV